MKAARLVLLLVFLVIALWNTGGYDLWAPDEPYFGEGAREMIADGQWLVPHVNGMITTDKPPLFFWLIALFSLPAGAVTSVTARLPSALAAVGSVWLTMRLGRRFGGEKVGLLAGVVLATAYLFWDKSRTAQIESLLCFLVLAALSFFEAFRSGGGRGRLAGILFWVSGGLATLAKGPVGLLIPLGVALLTLAFDRDLRSWRRFAPWLGPLAFVVIVGLWAAPAMLYGGEYSLWGAIKTHFIERGLHGMHHKNPIYYYLGVGPLLFLPWSGLLPGAFVAAWRRRGARPERFLWAWVIFVFVFFSISGERRNLYILPAFPALALLVALLAGRVCGWIEAARTEDHVPHQRWITLPMGLTGALAILLAAAAIVYARRAPSLPTGPAVVVAAVLAALGVALLAISARGAARRSLQVCGVGFALVYLVAVTVLYPAFNPQKSARAFAMEMRDITADYRAQGEFVVAFRTGNLPEAFSFFSHFYTVETDDPATFAVHLSRKAQVFAVADEAWLGELPARVRQRLAVVKRTELNSRNIVLIVNHAASPPS